MWTKEGDFYVDKRYGNDSLGNGSKEQPYLTATRAAAAAFNGARIILGPGLYEESVPTSKGLRWIADGFVLFYGARLTGSALQGYALIDGINFLKFQGSINAVVVYGASRMVNCRFEYSNINIQQNGPRDISFCVFRHVIFENWYTHPGAIQNNTFDTCTGGFRGASQGSFIVNNCFRNCNGLDVWAPPTVQPPVNCVIDHNNIEGALMGLTLQQWQAQAPWGNVNSYSLPASDVFVDVLDSRNDLNTFNSDWSLRSTLQDGTANPLLNGGVNNTHIGALTEGTSFSALQLFTGNTLANNILFDNAKQNIVLPPGSGAMVGVLETATFDLGKERKLDRLALRQNLVYNSVGAPAQAVDDQADPAPNALLAQKTTLTLKAKFGATAATLGDWVDLETTGEARIDGDGNGSGSDSFDRNNMRVITAQFVKFRLTLRRS